MSGCCYLGHIVTKAGVSTDPNKGAAVVQWPLPNTVSRLCSFLGFASYYGQFVPGFSTLAAPLKRLVAEQGKCRTKSSKRPLGEAWMPDCEHSFEELKV